MTIDTLTLEAFISKHAIDFACKRVDKRPDGLAWDENNGDHWRTNPRHFHCRITRETRSFSFYFSQGSAHTEDPTLADVLDCMASDSSSFDQTPSFEDWCADLGFDTDSRKAEKCFRACKRQSEQLKRILGQSAYEELLYRTERL